MVLLDFLDTSSQMKPFLKPRQHSMLPLVRRCLNRPAVTAAVGYLVVLLIVYGKVLFSRHLLLSLNGADITLGEVYGRWWIKPLLLHGVFPWWNPYVFSGEPNFTGSQTPLLYPPEWMDLVLPVRIYINLTLVAHTLLAGVLVFYWIYRRSKRFLGAFVAGAIAMLSAPLILHTYAGHLNNITTMAWVPLVLIGADLIIEERYAVGIMVATFAVAIQIFASQPEYSFLTLTTALLYLIVRLFGTRHPLKKMLAACLCVAWAIAIGAIELIPIAIESSESTRASGATMRELAATFSLPPENLMTLFNPDLFGGWGINYYGKWFVWETCCFFGVFGLVLAVNGVVASKDKFKITAGLMTCLLTMLALGEYTPIYTLVVSHIPGFDRLRGMCKFNYFALLFLFWLVAAGVDELVDSGRFAQRIAIAFAAIGCLLLTFALQLEIQAPLVDGWWSRYLVSIPASHSTYTVSVWFAQPAERASAALCASDAFFVATGFVFAASALLAVRKRWRPAAYLCAGLAVLELVVFASTHQASFDYRDLAQPAHELLAKTSMDDTRVLIMDNKNSGEPLHVSDVDGDSSFVLRRYELFMSVAEGRDPDSLDELTNMDMSKPSSMFNLLRLKYVYWKNDGTIATAKQAHPLPHLLLLSSYSIETDPEAILTTLKSSSFDPEKNVILEGPPGVQTNSRSGPLGKVHLDSEDCNSMNITADVSRPSLLLISDIYSKFWRAVPLAGSSQSNYHLVPADYVLRAVPLNAGHHHLRVEFVPGGIEESALVTVVSLGAWMVFACVVFRQRLKSA
jgi:hypothetical protein